MKLFLYVFHYLPWAGCCGLLVYVDRLRKEIQRRVRENAEATAAVLRNYVIVDGVQLPRPEDERWRGSEAIIKLTNGRGEPLEKSITTPALRLGPVCITGSAMLDCGENGVYISNNTLPVTPATRKYATSVWAAQRSRAVREALEKGETP